MKYAIGIDFGTNSVRAIFADVANGLICGSEVYRYAHGDMGVVTDDEDPNMARQHPADYAEGIEVVVKGAMFEAGAHAEDVVGIGVDATGSTPIPVDAEGTALALKPEFEDNPAAMAWLWKDHTSVIEAEEITKKASALRPEYLAKCGGTYSSEWFFAKVLKCARVAPEVYEAACTWVELSDWIPAMLSGTTAPSSIRRNRCAAGHKGLFSPDWNGYADAEFMRAVDPRIERLRDTLPDKACNIGEIVGGLCAEWAERLALREGTPISAGILDAHAGAVGSGVRPGVMVKILGTSTCDIAVAPLEEQLPDVPGICGIAQGSVLPGCHGLEAGQSAVGDIFNWYVHKLAPGEGMDHRRLDAVAGALKPGESGLLALDWHNGNRNILTDPQLSGMLIGLTLHTTPAEIFRALVEATAFGARVIIENFKECGIRIDRVINCGGIAVKSPLTMQIYADILGMPMEISDNEQSCALGAAIIGVVAAGIYPDFVAATAAMTEVIDRVYAPIPENKLVYDKLFKLYKRMHDLFGTKGYAENQFGLMKELISIRETVRGK